MDDYIHAIESVLDQFSIDAEVTGQTRGPAVTRYELALGKGVRIEKIANLHKNIAYAVASESVRVLAPIPGKSAVGIELPNEERETVRLADFANDDPLVHPLTVALGKTVDGEMLSIRLDELPHLLVGGTTGSGKSSFVNTALVSLLRNCTPEQVQLLLMVVSARALAYASPNGSTTVECGCFVADTSMSDANCWWRIPPRVRCCRFLPRS